MKKLFYTLFAALLFAATAQAQYVVVNGTVLNANGTNITIALSADSFITTQMTYSDSSGMFTDTLWSLNSTGVVYAAYEDCNGALQTAYGYWSPTSMEINITIDYCPAAPTNITVNGSFDNFVPGVVVIFYTDAIPGGQGDSIFVSPFSIVLPQNTFGSPITAQFVDCNGDLQTITVAQVFGTTNATFYADYCPSTSNPCAAPLFTASYDASTNAFTLEMDSSVNAMLGQFTWDFGDGSTSNDAYPSHVYAVDGIYNVCLTYGTPVGALCTYCHEIGIDAGGNIVLRTDAGFTVNVVPFGTNTGVETIPAASFDIYPNPVTNAANLTLYSDNAKTYTVEIFNATGQLLKSFNVEAAAGRNDVKLSTDDLAKGMYLMNVRFDSKTISRSFVK